MLKAVAPGQSLSDPTHLEKGDSVDEAKRAYESLEGVAVTAR